MSKLTMNCYIAKDSMRQVNNDLKPYLIEGSKPKGLNFSMKMIDKTCKGDGSYQLRDTVILIYVDENWFYNTRRTAKFYLLRVEMLIRNHCKK